MNDKTLNITQIMMDHDINRDKIVFYLAQFEDEVNNIVAERDKRIAELESALKNAKEAGLQIHHEAINAIGYVGAANYWERIEKAEGWVEDSADKFLAVIEPLLKKGEGE